MKPAQKEPGPETGTRGWGSILAKCGFTGISDHFWNVALPVPVKHPVGLGIPSGTLAAT